MEFAPDLCSRVTFVNFTVTRSSLQSQCLNQVLKAERPDVDKKRSDLLKLQGIPTILTFIYDTFSHQFVTIDPCLKTSSLAYRITT